MKCAPASRNRLIGCRLVSTSQRTHERRGKSGIQLCQQASTRSDSTLLVFDYSVCSHSPLIKTALISQQWKASDRSLTMSYAFAASLIRLTLTTRSPNLKKVSGGCLKLWGHSTNVIYGTKYTPTELGCG